MRRKPIVTIAELSGQAEIMPEIEPSAVMAMLGVLQAAEEIQHSIFDVLEERYQLSEGKLRVMIILYQNQMGLSLSQLAEKAGVSKATISVMLRKMVRDGYVALEIDAKDARSKNARLTGASKNLLKDILPGHYKRISDLIGSLNGNEREELIELLRKITSTI